MKKPLMNKIYYVTLKRCAGIYVDADSPEDAMRIAEKWKDDIDDDEFDDADVEVDSCDCYPDEADSDCMDTILTSDEAIDVEEYIDRYEDQDTEDLPDRGWDMTNQLELSLED